MMLMTAVTPVASDDSDAASSDSWVCTITINDTTITTKYAKNGDDLSPTTPVNGNDGNASVGSWTFDRETGYGPFGSFYAAFDPNQNNKMVCHLNPYNLKEAVDGGESVEVDGKIVNISECNIMWCLPKIYLSVTSSEQGVGTMTMASDDSDGGVLASAFTLKNGNDSTDYNFIALGVYEAYTDGEKLYSRSGVLPTTSTYDSSTKTYTKKVGLQDFIGYAKAAGADSGESMLWNFHQYQLYRFCSLAVMQNFDSQAQIGQGIVSSKKTETGTTCQEGPYYGTTKDMETAEKLFIENAWGNVSEYVGDAYWRDGSLLVGQNTDPTPDGSNKTGVGIPRNQNYGTAPYLTGSTVNWGIPTKQAEHSGTAPDYIYTTNNDKGLVVGGNWSDECYAGLSKMSGGNVDCGSSVGSRLVFLFDDDLSTIPRVTYNHDDLRELLKEFEYSEDLIEKLPDEPRGKETYDDLGEIEGFKHAGWIIDGKLYPVEYPFVKTEDHEARSVWIGLPAVTYDHEELIALSQNRSLTVGLSNGLEIEGRDSYEQLPSRDGYAHIGWRIVFDGKLYEVGPTDGFVTRNSHTAVSLWISDPTVTFDHTYLTNIVGTDAKGVSNLRTSMTIEGNSNYPQLPNTAGYRHIGWEIDGKTVGPTAGLVSEKTHDAKSLWEKISVIPIIPDGTEPEDPGAVVPIVIEEEHGFWLQKDGKSLLIIAIIAAIIAELAVLSISRKR